MKKLTEYLIPENTSNKPVVNEEAKSQAQRGLVFAKRNEYKTEKSTPEEWKWVWGSEWENKGELPDKVEEENLFLKNTPMTADNNIEEEDNGLYNSGDKTSGMPTIGQKGEKGKWAKQVGGMPVLEGSIMNRRRYRLKQSQMNMLQELRSIQEGIKKIDNRENPYVTKKQQIITEHQNKFFEEATKQTYYLMNIFSGKAQVSTTALSHQEATDKFQKAGYDVLDDNFVEAATDAKKGLLGKRHQEDDEMDWEHQR